MFIWAPCHVMCTAVLTGWDPAIPPLPPHLGSYYECAIGQQRLTIGTVSLYNPLNSKCWRQLTNESADPLIIHYLLLCLLYHNGLERTLVAQVNSILVLKLGLNLANRNVHQWQYLYKKNRWNSNLQLVSPGVPRTGYLQMLEIYGRGP
jgi:hypothetical protein